MEREYKSFYKAVGGNEGGKCHYATRLDTYGCGCQHDCSYCYAKSLLEFRHNWHCMEPSIADSKKIARKVKTLRRGDFVRLGGMTDCFMPMELRHRVTYNTIKALNDQGVSYLIVTKSDIVARDDYVDVLDKDLAHIQISLTCTDDGLYRALGIERAVPPSRRVAAAEKLSALGYDTQVRLSPYIPQFIDVERLAQINCDKILIEFLRVNSWVKRWLDIDYSEYTVKQSGYQHMPLERKLDYIGRVRGFERVTVCEDETEAYEYWQKHFNPNPNDCCDLRKKEPKK
ncbi:MAG: radical SAM protein [Lachnospiraceae bacterium]|nr:radical SAM protein [Lachnospiraceae bacterium]